MWTVVEMTGKAFSHCTVLILTALSCEQWTDAATVTTHWTIFAANCLRATSFNTRKLGKLPEYTLIWPYRSLQSVSGSCNLVLKNIRFAYHYGSVILISVRASFALIKSGDPLFESLMS